MTQSAVTKVVQKFVGAGMATLTPDTQDRRIKWVALTPKGFETLTTIQQSFAPAYAQLFKGMTSDELAGLVTQRRPCRCTHCQHRQAMTCLPDGLCSGQIACINRSIADNKNMPVPDTGLCQ